MAAKAIVRTLILIGLACFGLFAAGVLVHSTAQAQEECKYGRSISGNPTAPCNHDTGFSSQGFRHLIIRLPNTYECQRAYLIEGWDDSHIKTGIHGRGTNYHIYVYKNGERLNQTLTDQWQAGAEYTTGQTMRQTEEGVLLIIGNKTKWGLQDGIGTNHYPGSWEGTQEFTFAVHISGNADGKHPDGGYWVNKVGRQVTAKDAKLNEADWLPDLHACLFEMKSLKEQRAAEEAAARAQRMANLEATKTARIAETQAAEEAALAEQLRAEKARDATQTAALVAELAHQKRVIAVLDDIVRVRMAGIEARAELMQEHLLEVESNATAFSKEITEQVGRIRTLEELNRTIISSIAGHRAGVEAQLAEQEAVETELQQQLEELAATPTPEP